MNTRLRELRECPKINLSRAAFGKRIGVSGDVINNLERGRVEIKEPIIKLICHEFNVDYIWLTTGEGEMFKDSEDTFLEQIDRIMADENEFAKSVFKEFAKLDTTEWKLLERIIKKISDDILNEED